MAHRHFLLDVEGGFGAEGEEAQVVSFVAEGGGEGDGAGAGGGGV